MQLLQTRGIEYVWTHEQGLREIKVAQEKITPKVKKKQESMINHAIKKINLLSVNIKWKSQVIYDIVIGW